MNDPNGSTDAGAARGSDDLGTDPALSSHTFTGSADRVALRITPARGDAPPGAVEVIDAASQPVGTIPPQAEIVVRQLHPDTGVPATVARAAPSDTLPLPPPPLPLPLAQTQAGKRGGNTVRGRYAWFGIAAIVVALLAIGFLALQSFGRNSNAVAPSTSAPARVDVSATSAAPLVPTLAPLPSPASTAVPATSAPIAATSAPTVAPSPTTVPTATISPAVIAISTAVPAIVPTAVPPTSAPNAPPSPSVDVPVAAPQGGAIAAATAAPLPAIPPLPPGIRLPPTNIPSVPQVPRKPPSP